MVVFPLTLGIRLSFKRRETAIRHLSRHQATLKALIESLSISKLDAAGYAEAASYVVGASDSLLDILSQTIPDREVVLHAPDAIPDFLKAHRKQVKGANVQKLLLFHAKTSEAAIALLATKRYGTPVGLKPFMVLSLLAFLVFYPASLLHEVGFDVPLWYVYGMTAFKGVLLATLYNIHAGLEDPFLPGGLDSVRLQDFRLRSTDIPAWTPAQGKSIKEDDDDAD